MSHHASISPSSTDRLPMAFSPQSCRQRPCRQSSSRRSYHHFLILLVLCFRSAKDLNDSSAHAFAPSSSSWIPQHLSTTTLPTRAFMSAVADAPAARTYSHDSDPSSPSSSSGSSNGESSSNLSSFQTRMKGLVKRRPRPGGTGPPQRGAMGGAGNVRPENLILVNSLGEYKDIMDRAEVEDKMVVVRFYATWCKACKAIEPSFYRMANRYPNLLFVEVPVTNENVNLHQGLGVTSLPYGHIYFPKSGLVEELKISRKYFAAFEKRVQWYDNTECPLDEWKGDGKEKEPAMNGGMVDGRRRRNIIE